MSSKFATTEILLIYFLLLIPWPHTTVVRMLCSKDSSRLVRKIVRSKWTPILDKHQMKLPLDCPLHPFRDLYAPRQDAKKRDRPTQWTCRLCGKSFYQEKFLDLHFETRHKATINEAEDAICVADFCDIMRCDVFQTEESSSLKTGDQHIITDVEVWGDSLGQNSALAKANAAYLSLLPIRSSSLGISRGKASQIGSQSTSSKENVDRNEINAKTTANQNLNDNLNINNKNSNQDDNLEKATDTTNVNQQQQQQQQNQGQQQQQKKKDQQQTNKGESSENSNQSGTKENAQGSKSETGTGAGAGGSSGSSSDGSSKTGSGSGSAEGSNNDEKTAAQQNQTTNAQKMRANCRAEELHKLKIKCERLVRTCIGGLLLSMSDQSFKEMEEEMNKAVCWYLTCDRYWEDGPLEPRAFPWGLILILVFVLSTGICFCYYIIWILFDSEEVAIHHHHQQTDAGLQHQIYMSTQLQHHPTAGSFYQSHDYPQLYPAGVGPLEAAPTAYYYQQQQHQGQSGLMTTTNDLYPEPQRFEYRADSSPRHRYIGDQRQQAAAAVSSTTNTGYGTAATSLSQQQQTPSHHHHHHHHHHHQSPAYQQDILDRREYTSSRAIATTAVSSNNSSSGLGSASSSSHHLIGPSSSAGNISASYAAGSDVGASGGVPGKPLYNTHPRPLAAQNRHTGSSQQSLRGSSSSHDIIQNEVGQNEHYIYVTYPPDLKKRYFDKYE